jgi:hypothetical protein
MFEQGAHPCAKYGYNRAHLDGPCRCFVGGPKPAFLSFSNGETRVYLKNEKRPHRKISWRLLAHFNRQDVR